MSAQSKYCEAAQRCPNPKASAVPLVPVSFQALSPVLSGHYLQLQCCMGSGVNGHHSSEEELRLSSAEALVPGTTPTNSRARAPSLSVELPWEEGLCGTAWGHPEVAGRMTEWLPPTPGLCHLPFLCVVCARRTLFHGPSLSGL